MVGGFLIAFPGWMTTIIGAAITGALIAYLVIRKKPSATKVTAIST
jgi:hypothetical protein